MKVPNMGFVGVGRVTGQITPAEAFTVKGPDGAEVPVLDVAKRGTYHREFAEEVQRG